MKHTKRKISKIVDEMLNYLFHIGGTDINIKINDDSEHYIISFSCQFSLVYLDTLQELERYLSVERNEQMESYYWELAGETETNTELTLIGMMIDDFYFEYGDNQLELKLYRKK